MDLQSLIKKGESETLEFKENFDREAIETVGAFANTKGGITLIGVSDSGEVKGASAGKESLKDWANQISQSTEPSVIPDFEIVDAEGREVVCIRVAEIPIKPVSIRGRCFKRAGNSNRMMSPQEIAQAHLSSAGTSWDAFPARGAFTEDIDVKKVEWYVRAANDAGRRKIGKEEDKIKVLEKLDLGEENPPGRRSSYSEKGRSPLFPRLRYIAASSGEKQPSSTIGL